MLRALSLGLVYTCDNVDSGVQNFTADSSIETVDYSKFQHWTGYVAPMLFGFRVIRFVLVLILHLHAVAVTNYNWIAKCHLREALNAINFSKNDGSTKACKENSEKRFNCNQNGNPSALFDVWFVR